LFQFFLQLFLFLAFFLDLAFQSLTVPEFVVQSDESQQHQQSTTTRQKVPQHDNQQLVNVFDQVNEVNDDQECNVLTLVDQQGDGMDAQRLFVRVNDDQSQCVKDMQSQHQD
jgi:hypothetical protein